MKISSFYSSIIHLFVTICLMGLGLLFVSLKWLKVLCEQLSKTLLYKPESFMFLGVIFLILSMLLMISSYYIFRHNSISISTKTGSYDIDEQVIGTYVKKYFEKLLDIDHVETEIFIIRNKLDIVAYIPDYKTQEMDSILEKAQSELPVIFKEKFLYKNKFNIIFKYLS